MAMLGILILTEQMHLRINSCTISSLTHRAYQTTVIYVSLGTVMAMCIHIISCGQSAQFSLLAPLHC